MLAGETEAYRPLVERYERATRGLASRLLGPGGDADDLAQEAFVRAYRYLGSLKEPERFGPWLFQVVRSLCRDQNRRRETERKALERRRQILRWARVPSGDGIGWALERLPLEEHEALRLRYFEEHSYEEIARRMGKTFSQVDHLIRKARAHLARKLFRVKAPAANPSLFFAGALIASQAGTPIASQAGTPIASQAGTLIASQAGTLKQREQSL